MASRRNMRLGFTLRSEAEQCDSASELAIEGLVMEVIAQLIRTRVAETTQRKEHWLVRANEVIHDRYRDPMTLKNWPPTRGFIRSISLACAASTTAVLSATTFVAFVWPAPHVRSRFRGRQWSLPLSSLKIQQNGVFWYRTRESLDWHALALLCK